MNKIEIAKKIFSSKEEQKNLKSNILKSLCFLIALFFKPERWYYIAFKTYQLTSFFKIVSIDETYHFNIKRIRILDQLLSMLTRSNVPFHIPYCFNSPEIKNENGILYCATHLPLTKVCVKAMLENNYTFDAVLAWNPSSDNKIAIWGMKESHPAIKTDINVLLKTKSLLLNKGTLFLMINDHQNKSYSPNSLKLCKITKSKIAFCYTKLDKNGIISTWMEPVPFPYCKTDTEIEENLAYMKLKTNQILEEYKNRA